jgi:hypothetical protein
MKGQKTCDSFEPIIESIPEKYKMLNFLKALSPFKKEENVFTDKNPLIGEGRRPGSVQVRMRSRLISVIKLSKGFRIVSSCLMPIFSQIRDLHRNELKRS